MDCWSGVEWSGVEWSGAELDPTGPGLFRIESGARGEEVG